MAGEKLNQCPSADISLRIELKFQSNLLFITALSDTNMGNVSHTYCPLSDIKNEFIKVIIQMWETQFKISINEEFTASASYSTDKDINAIQIGGDVKQIRRVDHRQFFPSVWPPSASLDYLTRPLHFSNDIPIRFKPGHLIIVSGRFFGTPGSLYFNMKHSHNETQMFHMNVDFNVKKVYLSNLYPTKKDYISYT